MQYAIVEIPLSQALPHVQNADLLLWRGHGYISTVGRGVHYHASKLAVWGTDVMVLDTHWRVGGDCRLLARDVMNYSGKLDWFRANRDNMWPQYDRENAIRYMRRVIDQPYGFKSVLLASALHLPLVRLCANPQVADDVPSDYAPFCSEACSLADRVAGGVDPVPWCDDRITLPADLAKSQFYQYVGTLIYDGVSLTAGPPRVAPPLAGPPSNGSGRPTEPPSGGGPGSAPHESPPDTEQTDMPVILPFGKPPTGRLLPNLLLHRS